MTKQTITLLLLLGWVTCYTQNLVKNPRFELYYHLPDLKYEFGERYQDSAFICKYWHKVNETTPDYYHVNAINERYLIPNNPFGFHPVITGSAYVGFVPFGLVGGTEPISGEFKEPLERGKLYEVSFSYRYAGVNAYFYLDRIECIIGKDLDQFKYIRMRGMTSYERIITPGMNANVKFEKTLNNNGDWNRITGFYKAEGGERYITFGFFYQNEKLNKIIREYVSHNFVLGHNSHLEDRFFRKHRKHLTFIHRNPDYVPKTENRMLELTFEEETIKTSSIYQERISYYFIDDVSVKEVK
ncbi:hypothetical protein [Natronoflexus pectinivorans]|uniref:Uncharacterized protein n=1 Tax=Natronoflexus pectinivorans TaxID=682526 RepID=A0A4R2GHY1_9BACT|nr:hypothetical protein [Natronoflexus pectinivorans]TCO07752.1 hypothetical protein EV194_107136 [Natronoflexus pectinivorans]